jgi:hypothetical protein
MLVIGGDFEDNAQVFESVVPVDTVRCKRCMPYERDMPIYVCRILKVPLVQLWPQLKHYI